jgi:hypothetical protein
MHRISFPFTLRSYSMMALKSGASGSHQLGEDDDHYSDGWLAFSLLQCDGSRLRRLQRVSNHK